MSRLHNVLPFVCSIVYLFLSVSADVCDNYISFSTSVTDAFCQNSACRGYCALGSDVVKCMKLVYEDNFKECTLSSGVAPTSAPTSAPIPTTAVTTRQPTTSNTFSKRVAYFDWKNNNDVKTALRTALDNGFNYLILGFYVHQHTNGQMDTFWDASEEWKRLTPSEQKELLDYAHSKGGYILLSAGGGTENHDTFANSNSPTGSAYGKLVAEKALELGLDGLDFDSEGWAPSSFASGKASSWLIDATKAARDVLGANRILAHAPQFPYFSTQWAGPKGYGYIHQQVGNLVDFYFIQFYNQGSYEMNTYESLFVTAGGSWSQNSAVKEIIAQGVPQDKVVVGKYVKQNVNGSAGYVSPQQLQEILCRANREFAFSAGGGVWLYDHTNLDETLQFGKALAATC